MLTDSHCHLNLLDLNDFNNQLDNVLAAAANNDVHSLLCVCVDLTDYLILCNIADKYQQVKISVGLHPNNPIAQEPKAELLIKLANQHPACIAIGETGLDYYRVHEAQAQKQQRDRFREHIHAAITSQKPLIIHTRQAAEDTLQVMADENASEIGGVMHCFAEDLNIAKQAIDMNFYISFSGIVTFKNATTLQEVAQKIPLDRLLIETDSPYLAPVPYRGKQNHPALVKYVAQAISELRQISYEEVAIQTTENFKRCFKLK
ncbi:TatD family hydrolase [Legionella gresilensis]|uniref:TatD family hydrolase n=1 Tax=Legionella gresilensis TaxID=91823 RepID=UPI00104114CA|nr:TatD family hydrolase [Legionella gresilensis]